MEERILNLTEQTFKDEPLLYSELAFAVDNFVEVTMADDGSITITDEGAMEFQMMVSGVWGGQSYDDESLAFDKEHNGVLETDRLRAAWVPNYWVANDGMMGYYDESHFMTQERWYGDGDYPGIIDNKNWNITLDDTAISYIPERPLNIPAGQTVSIVATEVQLPSAGDNAASQPVTNVNPYEEFILNNAEGMKVETVFEIGLVVNETGAAYEMKDGESAQVRLFVGPENAQAIEEGKMFLIHIVGGETETYGAGGKVITAEKDGSGYTGYVIFSTDSFSPFVLVSVPGDLEVTFNGIGAANTCTVSISANQAYNCRLFIAAYNSDGRMLAVKVVDNCNLAANPQYTLEFSGTAAYVKAFMMETDGGFTPRCASVTDDNLNQ